MDAFIRIEPNQVLARASGPMSWLQKSEAPSKC